MAGRALAQRAAGYQADMAQCVVQCCIQGQAAGCGFEQYIAAGHADAARSSGAGVDRDVASGAGQNQVASHDQVFLQRIGTGRHGCRCGICNHPVDRYGRRLSDGDAAGVIQVQATAAHIGAEIGDFCLQMVAAADRRVRIQAQRIGINVRSAVGIVQHRTVQREQADRAPVGLIRQHRWATVAADARINQAQRDIAAGLDADVAAMGLQAGAGRHIDDAARLQVQRRSQSCRADAGNAGHGDVAAGQNREVAGACIETCIEVDIACQGIEQHMAATRGQQAAGVCSDAALDRQIAGVDIQHDRAVGGGHQVFLGKRDCAQRRILRADAHTVNACRDRVDGHRTGRRQEHPAFACAGAQRGGAQFEAIARCGDCAASLEHQAGSHNIGNQACIAVNDIAHCRQGHVAIAVNRIARHDALQRDVAAGLQRNRAAAAQVADCASHGDVASGQQVYRAVGEFDANIRVLQQVLRRIQADMAGLALDRRIQHDVRGRAQGLQQQIAAAADAQAIPIAVVHCQRSGRHQHQRTAADQVRKRPV